MEMQTEENLEIFVNPGIQHSFLQSLNQIKSKNWEIWTITFAEILMEMWLPGVLLQMVNLIILTYQNVVTMKTTRYNSFSITVIIFSIANLLILSTFQKLLAFFRFRFEFILFLKSYVCLFQNNEIDVIDKIVKCASDEFQCKTNGSYSECILQGD